MATGMEPKLILETAGAGISLANTLVKLILEHRARGEGRDPRLSELLAIIPGEALKVANQLVEEIEDFRQKLLDRKIDIDRSITQIQSDRGWWQYLTEGSRLIRNFEARVTTLNNDVGRFMGDFVALAKCMDDAGSIADAFGQSADLTAEIEAIIRRDVPLRKILDELLRQARSLRDALNALT